MLTVRVILELKKQSSSMTFKFVQRKSAIDLVMPAQKNVESQL